MSSFRSGYSRIFVKFISSFVIAAFLCTQSGFAETYQQYQRNIQREIDADLKMASAKGELSFPNLPVNHPLNLKPILGGSWSSFLSSDNPLSSPSAEDIVAQSASASSSSTASGPAKIENYSDWLKQIIFYEQIKIAEAARKRQMDKLKQDKQASQLQTDAGLTAASSPETATVQQDTPLISSQTQAQTQTTDQVQTTSAASHSEPPVSGGEESQILRSAEQSFGTAQDTVVSS